MKSTCPTAQTTPTFACSIKHPVINIPYAIQSVQERKIYVPKSHFDIEKLTILRARFVLKGIMILCFTGRDGEFCFQYLSELSTKKQKYTCYIEQFEVTLCIFIVYEHCSIKCDSSDSQNRFVDSRRVRFDKENTQY
jgi:hypothetical protein